MQPCSQQLLGLTQSVSIALKDHFLPYLFTSNSARISALWRPLKCTTIFTIVLNNLYYCVYFLFLCDHSGSMFIALGGTISPIME